MNDIIPKKKILEFGPYLKHNIEPSDVKYGLPKKIQYCKNCLISNQKPDMCAEHEHNIKTIKGRTIIYIYSIWLIKKTNMKNNIYFSNQ